MFSWDGNFKTQMFSWDGNFKTDMSRSESVVWKGLKVFGA